MITKFWENWIVLQPERILLRNHIQSLIPAGIVKILDVGAGDGRRYRDIFENFDYTSLDIDASLRPDIIASADNIPFPDKEFDFAFSSQMLEHVTDPTAVLTEIHRILQDDGYLLITVPQTNELHSEPFDYWRFTNFGMELL